MDAVESVHSGKFPLHYNFDSFCASEIVMWISRSIARLWQILCSEYPFYQLKGLFKIIMDADVHNPSMGGTPRELKK
jgi:hypothetical protein